MRRASFRAPPSMPRPLQGRRIGFIGAGAMGQALMRGLIGRGVPRVSLSASDPSGQVRRAVRSVLRVRVGLDNLAVLRHADIVVLAVKPQQCPEVIAQIAPHLAGRHLVLSIAAGISLRWLEARLPGIPVVRAMPNLPATIGRGFATIALGREAAPAHRAIAFAIFGAAGDVVELPERHFDAITAVSGSGPAYVFFLAEAWLQAARALGLPQEIAEQAIGRTLEGSVELLRVSNEPASRLIQRVASKGGTTEAALSVLAARRVSASWVAALQAAARRSKALSWS